jgi:hypothetical protein
MEAHLLAAAPGRLGVVSACDVSIAASTSILRMRALHSIFGAGATCRFVIDIAHER